jgi:Aminopeptidase N
MAEITHFYGMFRPVHYDVYLDINRNTKQFTGKTSITGSAKAETIYVHQKYLNIENVKADGKDVTFTTDDKKDLIAINLPKIGEMTLTITYNAKLTDSMMGIYPSYYEVDGVKKQIIGTQFETTFARQAFPCIDEPEAKATF